VLAELSSLINNKVESIGAAKKTVQEAVAEVEKEMTDTFAGETPEDLRVVYTALLSDRDTSVKALIKF